MGQRLDAVGGRPLFSVDGVDYAWSDALGWAGLRGTFVRFEEDVRRGIAGVARSGGIEQEAVSAEATSFRYAHGLLAAEELDSWLDRHQLTLAEWGAYLERVVARERFPEEPPVGEIAGDEDYIDGI